jgi:MFS family permease
MNNESENGLWSNRIFQKLYWAHVISLVGSGISSIALGLLAHALVGASASAVLGYTLAIRIAVIVVFSPWAGQLAERFGARATLIWSDLLRVGIVAAFFFVDAVWQIYALALFLNLGSAVFTPVYKAVIPGVVSDKDYPKALAAGSIAYDTSSILGPALAGLLIAIADIDEVIQVIRASDDADSARSTLMTVFDLSQPQADYILELRLRRLTKFSRIELERESAELAQEITELEQILASPERLIQVVGDELSATAKALGTPRRGAGMAGRRLRLSPVAAGTGVAAETWVAGLVLTDVIFVTGLALVDGKSGPLVAIVFSGAVAARRGR